MSIEIRDALESDLDAIAEIAQSHALGPIHGGPVDLAGGFLVSGHDKDTYERFLRTATPFLVAVEEDEIVGFLHGVVGPRDGETIETDAEIEVRTRGDYAVIRQVAIRRDHGRRGIGRQLYEAAIDALPDEIPIFAAIVDEPRNEASRAFHERLGFRLDFIVDSGRSRRREVWTRPAPPAPPEPSTLEWIEYYRCAMEQYRHEDALNWRKLSSLFYVTVALAGALTLAAVQRDSLAEIRIAGIVVSAVGAMASVLFHIACRGGIWHMVKFARAAREIEAALQDRFGRGILRARTAPYPFERIRTQHVIWFLPLFLLVAWLAAAIFFAVVP